MRRALIVWFIAVALGYSAGCAHEHLAAGPPDTSEGNVLPIVGPLLDRYLAPESPRL
jgi:hypothetical protein